MKNQYIFNFIADISDIEIPTKLNNPFGIYIPEIARIATLEFQEFISKMSIKWEHDFMNTKGKMFGILVVQKDDDSLSYLGTVSGKMPKKLVCDKFITSVFDTSTDGYFINKGMTELTGICNQINISKNTSEIESLSELRKQKSYALQQYLFSNYKFTNTLGNIKNVIEIFKNSSHGNPPVAAGECTAPKLLQYAFNNSLKPIALAEFWWGSSNKTNEREHLNFYPACKNRCRPILEYMLDNTELFNKAN